MCLLWVTFYCSLSIIFFPEGELLTTKYIGPARCAVLLHLTARGQAEEQLPKGTWPWRQMVMLQQTWVPAWSHFSQHSSPNSTQPGKTTWLKQPGKPHLSDLPRYHDLHKANTKAKAHKRTTLLKTQEVRELLAPAPDLNRKDSSAVGMQRG